jgi:oxygen-independent coproporphyrinogen-3 oxidase
MDYIARVGNAAPVMAERRAMDAVERLEEALFTGLRLVGGLDLQAIAARYGVDVWGRYGAELQRAVDAGLLTHEPGRRLALTRHGMLLANEVMAVFIGTNVR